MANNIDNTEDSFNLSLDTAVQEDLAQKEGDGDDLLKKRRILTEPSEIERRQQLANISPEDDEKVRLEKLQAKFERDLEYMDFRTMDSKINADNPTDPPIEDLFGTPEDLERYEGHILKPVEDFWNEDSDYKTAMIKKAKGDEAEAKREFKKQYSDYVKKQFELETQSNNLRLMTDLSILLGDPNWSTPIDRDFFAFKVPAMAGGITVTTGGYSSPIRSHEEYMIDGANGYYITYDDGTQEYKEFQGDGDKLLDAVGNPSYANEDGKIIVGFEYLPITNFTRVGERRGPAAIFQGQKAKGEIVDVYSLNGVGQNGLRGTGIMPLVSTYRSLVGVISGLAIGAIETSRSLYTLGMGGVEPEWGQDSITQLKAYKLGKSQYDKQNILTLSNGLDLLGDIVFQLALAIGTGVGASAILTKLITSASTVNKVSRGITGLVYGMIAMEPLKDEAIKAGFSPASASLLSLVFLVTIGAIGANSNLVPGNLQVRAIESLTRKSAASTLAIASKGIKNGTAITPGFMRFGTKLSNKLLTAQRKFGDKIASTKSVAGQYAWHGAEEMFEEQLELAFEVAYKAGWNTFSTPQRVSEGKKPGFMTWSDSRYWEQVGVEFIMSSVAGGIGGVLGRALPWTAGNINKELLPYQEEEFQKLYRFAFEVGRDPARGKVLLSQFIKNIKTERDAGGLGSEIFVVKRDPETGRYLTIEEDPDGVTHARANELMIMYQLNRALRETSGFSGTYEEFLDNPNNASIIEAMEAADIQYVKLRDANTELNTLFGDIDPLLVATTEDEKAKTKKTWREKVFGKSKKSAKEEGALAEKEVEKVKEEDADENEADAKEVSNAESKEEATPKVTTPAIDQDTEESEETSKSAEQTDEEKAKEDDIKSTAAGYKISEDAAKEIKDITQQIDDLLVGKTVEKDYIQAIMMTNPKLKALLGLNFDFNYLDELVISDVNRLLQDEQDYKDFLEGVKGLRDAIADINSLESIFSLQKLANSDGLVFLSSKDKNDVTDKYNEHLNLEVTGDEAMMQAKQQIAKNNDLYEDPQEATDKLYNLVTERENKESWIMSVEEEVAMGRVTSEEDKKSLVSKFVNSNIKTLNKIAHSLHLESIRNATGLVNFKYDATGEALRIGLIKTLDPDEESLSVVDIISSQSNNIESRNTVDGSVIIHPFNESIPLYSKVKPYLDQWKVLSENVLTTNVPRQRTEMDLSFLLRDFDRNAKVPVTHKGMLFNTNFFYDPAKAEEDRTHTRRLYDTESKGLLENFKVDRSSGVPILLDKKGAEELLEKLEIRKAQLSLISGDFAGTRTEAGKFLDNLANLRVHNAKVFSGEDYMSKLDSKKYTNFTQYYTNYIFDPVLYRQLRSKYLSDAALSFDAKEQFSIIQDKLNVMHGYLLRNITAAIEQAKLLVLIGDASESEVALEKSYKDQVQFHVQDQFAKPLKYFLDDHQELIGEETHSVLDALHTKLIENDGDTDDKKLELYKTYREISKVLFQLPTQVKQQVYEVTLAGTRVRHGDLMAMITTDREEFLSHLQNVNLPHELVIQQERVAFLVYAHLTSLNKKNTPNYAEGYDWYDELIVVNGVQGSGKSTIALAAGISTAQAYLKLNEKSAKQEHKVLLVSNSLSQVNNLKIIASEAGLDIARTLNNKSALTLKEFFQVLDPDDIEGSAIRLKDVSLIAYDEITQLQAGSSSMSMEEELKTDLGAILTTIQQVNAIRARGDNPLTPIKMAGFGDATQGGWVTGDPSRSNNWVTTTVTDPVPNNIAQRMKVLFMHVTPALQTPFRSSSSDITTSTRQFEAVSSLIRIVDPDTGEAHGEYVKPTPFYGQDKKEETQKWAGTEIVHNEREGIWENEELADEIRKQLGRDVNKGRFKVGIIYNKAKDNRNEIPEGPLKTLVDDPQYQVNIEILSEKEFIDRVIVEGHREVQGSEFDYVIAVPQDGFIKPFSKVTAKNSYTYRLVAVMIGRARYYTRIYLNESTEISSTHKEGAHLVSEVTRSKLEEEWGKFRKKMYEGIDPGAVTKTKPDGDVKATKPVSTHNIFPETKDSSKPFMVPDSVVTNLTDIEQEVAEVIESYKLPKETTVEEAIIIIEEQIAEGRIEKSDSKVAEELSILTEAVTLKNTVEITDDTELENVAKEVGGDQKSSDPELTYIDEEAGWKKDKRSGKYVYKSVKVGKTGPVRGWKAIKSQASEKMAKFIAKLGHAIGHSHLVKKYIQPLSSQSLQLQNYYLIDVLGKGNVMPVKDVLFHKKRAGGTGPRATKDSDMDQYTYQLITYEYFYKNKMEKKTAVVADYKGKSFILHMFANEKIREESKEDDIGKFLADREKELTIVEGEWKQYSKGLTVEEGASFDFPEFHSTHRGATAAMQNLSGKSVKVNRDGKIRDYTHEKAPAARIQNGRIRGSIYVTYDITDVMKTGDLIVAHARGEIATAADGSGKLIGDIRTLTGDHFNYEGLPAMVSNKKFPISLDYIETMDALAAVKVLDKKVDHMFSDKVPKKVEVNGEEYIVFTFRGALEFNPIPFAYNLNTGEWKAVFGIDREGNFIENLNVANEPIYYDYQTQMLRDALVKTGVSGEYALLPITTKEEAWVYYSDQLEYDASKVLSIRSSYSRFKAASEVVLKKVANVLGDVKMDVSEFIRVIRADYEKSGNTDAIQFSEPRIWSGTMHKGKVFMLYTHNVNHDLTTDEGVQKLMLNLVKFDAKFSKDTDPIEILKIRDGVGVIMLDTTPQTFTSLNKLAFGASNVKAAALNDAVVSINSATTKRLITMMAQLAWAMRTDLINYKEGTVQWERLELLMERIYGDDPFLTPVIDEGRLDIFISELKQTLQEADPDSFEYKAAERFVSVIGSITQSHNMSHLMSDKDGVKTPHVSGPVRKVKINTISNRAELFKRRASIIFFPKSITEPTAEDAAAGMVNPINEDRFGFNVIEFMHTVRGRAFEAKVDDGVVDILFELFDEVMLDYSLPKTLGRGLMIAPAASKSRSDKDIWDKIADQQAFETNYMTKAKAIFEPSAIYDVAMLQKAIDLSIKPEPINVIKYKTFVRDVDKITAAYSIRLISVPKADANAEQLVKDLLLEYSKDIRELHNLNMDVLTPTELDYTMQGVLELRTLASKFDYNPEVNEKMTLNILRGEGMNADILNSSKQDLTSVIKSLNTQLSNLSIAITHKAIDEIHNNILTRYTPKILNTTEKGNIEKYIKSRVDFMKSQTEAELGSQDQVNTIILGVNSGTFTAKKLKGPTIDATTQAILNYNVDLKDRDKILNTYLASSDATKEQLIGAVHTNPFSATSMIESGYARAHTIMTLLRDPDSNWKSLQTSIKDFKTNHKVEYDRWSKLVETKTLIIAREKAGKAQQTDYNGNLESIQSATDRTAASKLVLLLELRKQVLTDAIHPDDAKELDRLIIEEIDKQNIIIQEESQQVALSNVLKNKTSYKNLKEAADRDVIVRVADALEAATDTSRDLGLSVLKESLIANSIIHQQSSKYIKHVQPFILNLRNQLKMLEVPEADIKVFRKFIMNIIQEICN